MTYQANNAHNTSPHNIKLPQQQFDNPHLKGLLDDPERYHNGSRHPESFYGYEFLKQQLKAWLDGSPAEERRARGLAAMRIRNAYQKKSTVLDLSTLGSKLSEMPPGLDRLTTVTTLKVKADLIDSAKRNIESCAWPIKISSESFITAFFKRSVLI